MPPLPSPQTISRLPKEKLLEILTAPDNSMASNDDAWNARIEELKLYKDKYGNCLVPKKSRTHPQLGIWVMNQRAQYKLLHEHRASTMTPERMEALEEAGFVWSMCDHVDWDARLQELREYRDKHGDCLVPNKYPPNPQLGT
jgi:hypothetical protein